MHHVHPGHSAHVDEGGFGGYADGGCLPHHLHQPFCIEAGHTGHTGVDGTPCKLPAIGKGDAQDVFTSGFKVGEMEPVGLPMRVGRHEDGDIFHADHLIDIKQQSHLEHTLIVDGVAVEQLDACLHDAAIEVASFRICHVQAGESQCPRVFRNKRRVGLHWRRRRLPRILRIFNGIVAFAHTYATRTEGVFALLVK